jgi:hypothetical protein
MIPHLRQAFRRDGRRHRHAAGKDREIFQWVEEPLEIQAADPIGGQRDDPNGKFRAWRVTEFRLRNRPFYVRRLFC